MRDLLTATGLVSLCLLSSFLTLPVQAQTLNVVDRGFYRNDGDHPAGNVTSMAYTVGDGPGANGFLYRNWFLFAVPTLNVGETYVGATLRLYTAAVNGYSSPDPTETYNVTDFSGSFADLVTLGGNGNGFTFYDDLGPGGAVYGTHVASAADQGTYVEITLSAAVLSDINAAANQSLVAGGNFALGGYISTLNGTDDTESVFNNVAGLPTSATQLVLVKTSIPEPGTLALLGLALPVMGIVRRRKA